VSWRVRSAHEDSVLFYYFNAIFLKIYFSFRSVRIILYERIVIRHCYTSSDFSRAPHKALSGQLVRGGFVMRIVKWSARHCVVCRHHRDENARNSQSIVETMGFLCAAARAIETVRCEIFGSASDDTYCEPCYYFTILTACLCAQMPKL